MSNWNIYHGDCIPHMAEEMEPQSVDMAIFSPAFPALYAYSSDPADMGNTDTLGPEAKVHLSFFYNALARVLKPGRVAIVHVMQIPRMKRTGEVGLHDFRGTNIRIGERAGLVYEYDWLVRKNPQAQAIQTRSRELQFAGLESDRAKQRGTLGDYIIKFRAPGENAVPIRDFEVIEETKLADQLALGLPRERQVHPVQVSRNNWIDWAEASWADIRQTFTLNWKIDKGDDTRHICPLQLDVIERCIRLYSNPGELVFSPFTGIGSEGYMALQLGRRFYGCELKSEYVSAAKSNFRKIERKLKASKQNLLNLDEEEIEVSNEVNV